MRRAFYFPGMFILTLLAGAGTIPAAVSCDKLAALSLPHATVTMAARVEAGSFVPPPVPWETRPPDPAPFRNLPAFCRVAATLTPSRDSMIHIEVWLPVDGWNGKFMGVGNGGWAGSISYGSLAGALRRGYAAASTDTGHQGAGQDGSWIQGHPEKLVDYGYRAVHEMTVKAKALVEACYGRMPRYSYWSGCSNGGRQALKEAQQFPADYDGIIAGAPANSWSRLMASQLWIALAVHRDEAAYIPPKKYARIHKAALEACDAQDGIRDGVLDDPTRCRFDPKELECKSVEADDCLTAAQVEAARKIYAPLKNPRTGEVIFPGLEPGSELGWAGLAGPVPFPLPKDYFGQAVLGKAGWDWKTFDFDRDLARALRADPGKINADHPDLRPFAGRGGKLLIYFGWNDQLIPPRDIIRYYESAVQKLGGAAKASGSVRLFMVPGTNHCGGGDGPCKFDMVGPLEQWVEQRQAPDRIIGSHETGGVTDRTRPLCPYPLAARYKGTGSTDDAANFECK